MVTILPALLAVLAQDPDPATLDLHVVRLASGGRTLVLEGPTSIPEGTRIRALFYPVRDRYSVDDGRILPGTSASVADATAIVKDRRLRLEIRNVRPGVYPVTPGLYLVKVHPFDTPARLLASQEIAVYDGNLLHRLNSRIEQLSSVAEPSVRALREIERAGSASDAKSSLESLRTLDRQVKRIPATPPLELAREELSRGVSQLVAIIEDVEWNEKDKKLGRKTYYKDARKEFSVSNHLRHAEAVAELAGRETCLWIIREFRREGSATPALLRLVQKHRDRPGVREFAERLQTLTPESAGPLEREIRRTPDKE